MQAPILYLQQLARIRHYALVLAVIWTAILSAFATWELYSLSLSALESARIEARASFNKDLLYRRWAALHGGVYVPVSEDTLPNPYLKVPEREITTPSGRVLTLVNPAYMTRQVHELGRELFGIQGHITSLNPIRPANAPDDWERIALTAFESGVVETSSVETMDGQIMMRYMQRLLVEPSCMNCHADQGYKVGDVRGGISVAVPLQPYWNAELPIQIGIVISHFVLWLSGMGGILLATNRIESRAYSQELEAQRLHRSEERQRVLINAIPDTLFRIRKDGVFLDYHSSTTNPLFASSENLIGKTIFDVMPKHVADPMLSMIHAAISRQQVVEYQYEVPMGEQTYHTEIRTIPAGEDEVLCITRDISASVQAKQREVELALEKDRMRLLSTFVQNTAHEFRTPLSIIISSADLLFRSTTPEQQLRKLGQIDAQVQQINKLVDRMLLMVKIESKTKLPQLQVNLEEVVEVACQSISTAHGHKLLFNRPDKLDLPKVTGDADDLVDAFKQVLENAYHFTPPGGTITLTTGITGNRVWLEVRDTGAGIDAESLPRIFEAFWRHDAAHSTPGFGLGLSIAQKIVQRHGGAIEVESAVGMGSAFRIWLPMAEALQFALNAN